MRSHQNYINKNQFRSVKDLFLKALKEIPILNPTQAIDLGCGLGIETAYLANAFDWSVLAIDGNAELLAMAKNKIKDSQKTQVEFLHCSFEYLANLPSCDFLYSYHSLHFIDDAHFERVWTMMLSALKPNGVIALSLFGPEDAMVKKKHAIGISEDELRNRLKNLNIKYIHSIKERGQEIQNYIEVIAIKNNSIAPQI